MEIIEEIKIAEHIEKKKVYICDFCHKKRIITVCCICKKHACLGAFLDGKSCALRDPNDCDDYPDSYCPICYELRFKTFYEEIDKIESEAIEKKEKIVQKIKLESLKEQEKYEIEQRKI